MEKYKAIWIKNENLRILNEMFYQYGDRCFTSISIDSLTIYESKYYLQVFLDNCAYKIVNKEMTDYLDENVFED